MRRSAARRAMTEPDRRLRVHGPKQKYFGDSAVPSLVRFVLTVLFIGMAGYGGMVALANLVEPQEREIITTVPVHPRLLVKPGEPGRVKTAAAPSTEPADDPQASDHEELFSTLESMPFMTR